MGGPVITTRYGRLDAQQASQSAPSGTGRLPEPSVAQDTYRALGLLALGRWLGRVPGNSNHLNQLEP